MQRSVFTYHDGPRLVLASDISESVLSKGRANRTVIVSPREFTTHMAER